MCFFTQNSLTKQDKWQQDNNTLFCSQAVLSQEPLVDKRNSFRFVTVNDFVFIRKRNELLFIRVVHDISFRQTRPFSIPSDIASGIVSIRQFFTNEHIPNDFVEQLSNREEISNAILFPPERLDRYWNR